MKKRVQEKIGDENSNEQSQWYTVTDDIKEEAPSGQAKDQEKEDKEREKSGLGRSKMDC